MTSPGATGRPEAERQLRPGFGVRQDHPGTPASAGETDPSIPLAEVRALHEVLPA